MLFTRTHIYRFPVPKEYFKNHLVGQHVKIHDLDFEIVEKVPSLSIIPHAEQELAIKTLPITYIDLKEDEGKTKVVITFKMRKLDSGGPMLILTFCTFMLIAAVVLFMIRSVERPLPYTLAGIGIGILILFSIRMQTGYFDYIRKIRAYVKSRGDAITSEGKLPLAGA
ncbi:MAG: hypothetical protein ACHP6H_02790 [Legionellales bacterium]